MTEENFQTALNLIYLAHQSESIAIRLAEKLFKDLAEK